MHILWSSTMVNGELNGATVKQRWL